MVTIQAGQNTRSAVLTPVSIGGGGGGVINGTLNANSIPTGAQVVVIAQGATSGHNYGVAPQSADVAPGTYTVTFYLDNYFPKTVQVTITSGVTTNVTAQLTEIFQPGTGYGGYGYPKEYVIQYAADHNYLYTDGSGRSKPQLTVDYNYAEAHGEYDLQMLLNAIIQYSQELQVDAAIRGIMAQHPGWTYQQAAAYYANAVAAGQAAAAAAAANYAAIAAAVAGGYPWP